MLPSSLYLGLFLISLFAPLFVYLSVCLFVCLFVCFAQKACTYHMVVACSPAESNFPVNMAMFSPASFLSPLLECCNVRAFASFSAQVWASLARSSAHFKGGTPCMERHLLCVSRDCFENGPLGDDVAELEGVNLSAKAIKIILNFNKKEHCHQLILFISDRRLHW